MSMVGMAWWNLSVLGMSLSLGGEEVAGDKAMELLWDRKGKGMGRREGRIVTLASCFEVM